jgi:hypothetical protein
MEGRKNDTGKDGFHLLPDDALAEIQKVLDFGVIKYEPRNWEKGMAWTRLWNAIMRHAWAWIRREPADPETDFSHLAHLACCALFLLAYEKRMVGMDDRPEAPPRGKQED